MSPVLSTILVQLPRTVFPLINALLAGLVVCRVAFVRPRRAIPFVGAAAICGWALVLNQSHYIIDVVVSWLLVITGAGVAVILTRLLGWPALPPLAQCPEVPRHPTRRCVALAKLAQGVAGGSQKLLAAKRRIRELKR